MDAPKCRLCGEKHYGGCKFTPKTSKGEDGGEKANGDGDRPEPKVARGARPPERGPSPSLGKEDIKNCPTCGRPLKPKRDRAEYMREYRKRKKGEP